MAVKDWSATRLFLLKNDLRLAMAVKYYTIKIRILNNDNAIRSSLLKIKLESGHIL